MGMSYAWLGPVGELRQVPCPQAGVQVTPDRPTSTFTALSGRRVVQRSQRVYNSWALSFQWSDADVVAWLGELASGSVVGDCFLYTSVAARENLAPKQLQSGGSGVVANRRVLASGDEAVGTYIIPCRPNTSYTLSCLVTDGAQAHASTNSSVVENIEDNVYFESDSNIPEGTEISTADPTTRMLYIPPTEADGWGYESFGETEFGE